MKHKPRRFTKKLPKAALPKGRRKKIIYKDSIGHLTRFERAALKADEKQKHSGVLEDDLGFILDESSGMFPDNDRQDELIRLLREGECV